MLTSSRTLGEQVRFSIADGPEYEGYITGLLLQDVDSDEYVAIRVAAHAPSCAVHRNDKGELWLSEFELAK